MAQVVIVDNVAPEAGRTLARAGHKIQAFSKKLDLPALIAACAGCQALIVRSATDVTAGLIAACPELQVVGRAGVGTDNIDVDAATRQGVLVVNAPTGNTIAAAEHALGLMLALARNIPQASSTLRQGRWERAQFRGVELMGKTLGILGLGRVGSAVALRAQSLGMRVLGYDPYLNPDNVIAGVVLADSREVFAQSDFLTLHLPLSAETRGFINHETLAMMKPGIRIINTARGGLIVEEALISALTTGQVAGAALDVLAEEPCTDSPLFELENVIITPHLGASTEEAQAQVATEVARQVAAALAGQRPHHCLNWDQVQYYTARLQRPGVLSGCNQANPGAHNKVAIL